MARWHRPTRGPLVASLALLFSSASTTTPASAADVDGTWIGTLYVGDDERKVIVVLESFGTRLDGISILHPDDVDAALRRLGLDKVVGRSMTIDDMPHFPIQNGKIDDEVIVFDVESPAVAVHFELLARPDDTLVGTLTRTPKVHAPAARELNERLATGRVIFRRGE